RFEGHLVRGEVHGAADARAVRGAGAEATGEDEHAERSGHQFSAQIERLRSVAKAIHSRYGTRSQPATVETRKNARTVSASTTRSTTITTAPPTMDSAPKKIGVQTAFRTSCAANSPSARRTSGRSVPARQTRNAAIPISA